MSSAKILAALVCSVLTFACSKAEPTEQVCIEETNQVAAKNICHGEFTIYASDFSSDELVSMMKAESSFNAFFGKPLLHLSVVSDRQASCQLQKGEDEADVWARYYGRTGIVKVNTLSPEDSNELVNTLEHEIFHGYGAIHKCNSLMQAVDSHDWSAIDMQQAQDLGML